ncbi:hypothetical protein ACG04R_02835 [Roseateles sp. BYS78W]|uniref:Uncharacterized protein n=1 Tax=Pelomonas candidula TaxID=3299025 RepID=A0ABW7H722_9BURK
MHSDSEKMAVAAHLHVLMRRKMGRVTDVEWLVRNADYAQEIIRLACQQAEHPEVADWGARLRAMLFPKPPPAPSPKSASAVPVATRYVGGLR